MNYLSFTLNDVEVQYSVYKPLNGVPEAHAILNIHNKTLNFKEQLARIHEASSYLLKRLEEYNIEAVMTRYFLSDIANQKRLIEAQSPFTCPCSFIGQPPANGTKISVWIWMSGESKNYTHLRMCNYQSSKKNGLEQTSDILESYENTLQKNKMSIANNCIRTWFYVRDIDRNYSSVVEARKKYYTAIGLSPASHYIASTGIEGETECSEQLISFDAYAISGLQTDQIKYIQALDHLNPTYQYGVTFERATKISYGDRSHLIVSGTASIDNKGNILYVDDAAGQTRRVWENIQALLHEGEFEWNDVNHCLVYLRDIADYSIVRDMFQRRFPQIPTVFVLAPVCRPGWLIEMECMATRESIDNRFAVL